MKVPVFTGSSAAVITPFRDGRIDYDRFGEQIDFQINGGTAAITVCGTTGEASTLSDKERLEAIDFCTSRVNGRIKVIAGTGSNDTKRSCELSRKAEKLGADAVLCVTPYYNKTTQAGLFRHYGDIADSINVPLILYDVPGRTGMTITKETYRALSKHPNINGVKEASGSLRAVSDIIAVCGDELYVWSGSDEVAVPAMSVGAKGVISVLANILPRETAEMAAYALTGNFAEAAHIQLKYLDLIEKLFLEVNPIPIKAAMKLLGTDSGQLRLPLCPMSPENLAQLCFALYGAGLLPETAN